MNVNIKEVVKVKAVNRGIGHNDNLIHKIKLDNNREYLYKHGEFTAGGVVDTFIPIEWISKEQNGDYDMSTELINSLESNVRGILKLKPFQYERFIK